MFPNKTGRNDDNDQVLLAELEAAGIPNVEEDIGKPLSDTVKDILRKNNGEVVSWVRGVLHGWEFKRAWYYWVAKGPGVEIAVAEKLQEQFGTSLRVDGYAGGQDPRERFKGLAVGCYHVDTPEALKALADAIKGICEAPGPIMGDKILKYEELTETGHYWTRLSGQTEWFMMEINNLEVKYGKGTGKEFEYIKVRKPTI